MLTWRLCNHWSPHWSPVVLTDAILRVISAGDQDEVARAGQLHSLDTSAHDTGSDPC